MKSPELKRKDRIMRNTLIGSFIVGIALAFLTPEDILNYPLARDFVDVMRFIPYVNDSGDFSSFPQVASFFAAVMWALTPVVFVCFWEGAYPIPEVIPNEVKTWQAMKCGAAFLVFLLILMRCPYLGHNKISTLAVSTQLGMGIIGTLLILLVPPFALLVTIKVISNWRFFLYGDVDALVKQNQKID